MTVVLAVDAQRPDAGTIARAAACLRTGGLVAFPTETVYGLGVHALDPVAVRKLFEAKARPADDPLIVHVPSLAEARELVTAVPSAAAALAARFWPGPLTLVLPKSRVVPDEVTAGLPSVAIRVPSHPVAQALLARQRRPDRRAQREPVLPAESDARGARARRSGRPHRHGARRGPTTVGVESTVVDLTGPSPRVLRPGGVSLEALAAVARSPPARAPAPVDTSRPMPSPGLLERHYSPRAPLTVYEGEAVHVIGGAARGCRGGGARRPPGRPAADGRRPRGRAARARCARWGRWPIRTPWPRTSMRPFASWTLPAWM